MKTFIRYVCVNFILSYLLIPSSYAGVIAKIVAKDLSDNKKIAQVKEKLEKVDDLKTLDAKDRDALREMSKKDKSLAAMVYAKYMKRVLEEKGDPSIDTMTAELLVAEIFKKMKIQDVMKTTETCR